MSACTSGYGLVHISMMSYKFIKDPRELVKAGDVVKVKVLEVDLQRRRVALTMKLGEASGARPTRNRSQGATLTGARSPPRGRDVGNIADRNRTDDPAGPASRNLIPTA